MSQWVCERIRDMPRPPEKDFEAIGFANADGELIGGIVYTVFRRNMDGSGDICLTAAGNVGWFTKANLRVIFDYPFNRLRCCRVTALTAKANRKTRDVLERLGFKHEGTLRDGFGVGKDAILYGMTRTSCRWIK